MTSAEQIGAYLCFICFSGRSLIYSEYVASGGLFLHLKYDKLIYEDVRLDAESNNDIYYRSLIFHHNLIISKWHIMIIPPRVNGRC